MHTSTKLLQKLFALGLQIPCFFLQKCAKSRRKPHNNSIFRQCLPPLLHCLVLASMLANATGDEPWDGIVISEIDYQGLQALKHELEDSRRFLRSWNGTGLHACSGAWEGIKCVKGKVIAIRLPSRWLGGRISEKIGQLTALRKLSLHDNSIGGEIPPVLGSLRDLRGVYLFNNRFSGTIPPSVGGCLALQAFDVSNNSLTGEIPPSLFNSTMLYKLNLSYNALSGGVPASVARAPSLAFLSLQHNNLSGAIPDSWGGTNNEAVYRLQVINLDHNYISGSIPKSMSMLKMLGEISLSDNTINGSVPEEFGVLSRLWMLDLSENNITGEIPESLTRLVNLSFFNVSYNNLSGHVPWLLAEKFNSSSFRGNIQLCGYNASLPCPRPPSSHNSPGKAPTRRLSTKDTILIVASIALVLLLLLSCLLLCLHRKISISRKNKANSGTPTADSRGEKPTPEAGADVEASGDMGGKLVHFDGPLEFTADDLLCATAEIMGKSSYGTVYKATLRDGNHVAVKRLREKIAKGNKEFEAEVEALGRVRHRNLLALRAYYLGPKEEKLLVFDYMPIGSLAAFLHSRNSDAAINWPTRINIAIEAARGLCYLHSEINMVHGNLNSCNILLDDNLEAKISDFGLSRLMTAAINANAIAAAGMLGYRAPELRKLKQASSKTDVYSLGVVILELLTGKAPGEVQGVDLPLWVAAVVQEEWTSEVFDLELVRDDARDSSDELLSTLKLALQCVDPSPAARPEARQVLQQLEEIKRELAGEGVATGSAL